MAALERNEPGKAVIERHIKLMVEVADYSVVAVQGHQQTNTSSKYVQPLLLNWIG